MKKEVILAWHFVSSDKRLRYGDNRLVEEGETYDYTGEEPPTLCECGVHASRRVSDAAKYAPGAILCRVEVSGDVIEGGDKLVGRKRKVLWMMDATNILIEWACDCAERALDLLKDPDPRPLEAIKVIRNYLKGIASKGDVKGSANAAYVAANAAYVADYTVEKGWQEARLLELIEGSRKC